MKVTTRKQLRLASIASVMDRYFDEYDYYSFDPKVVEPSSRKGRTKTEARMNTNRPNPAGHERKVTAKFVNTEHNRRKTVKWSPSWNDETDSRNNRPMKMKENGIRKENPDHD